MAVDRGNAAVSKLYDPIQPAVLRLIETTIKKAPKMAGIPGRNVRRSGSRYTSYSLALQMGA